MVTLGLSEGVIGELSVAVLRKVTSELEILELLEEGLMDCFCWKFFYRTRTWDVTETWHVGILSIIMLHKTILKTFLTARFMT